MEVREAKELFFDSSVNLGWKGEILLKIEINKRVCVFKFTIGIWLVSKTFYGALNATVLLQCMVSTTLDADCLARISTLIIYGTTFWVKIFQ